MLVVHLPGKLLVLILVRKKTRKTYKSSIGLLDCECRRCGVSSGFKRWVISEAFVTFTTSVV
jgi:hypothetical protein